MFPDAPPGERTVSLELSKQGVVVTPGSYFKMKWWHLLFLAVAFKQGKVKEGQAYRVPITDQDREAFNIQPEVNMVQVGRKRNGRYYVKEIRDDPEA